MIKNKNINFLYFNKTFNKSRLKKLIYWSITLFGEKKTVDLVEILKKIGYSYATKAGLSLSIDDLQIPLIKNKLLFNTESKLNYTNQDVEKSYLTSIEYFSQVIDTWNNTNELLKQEVINNFKNKDVLNPVYMMAFSGARGNISQVRQLVGMRGLMADPSGRIINFPIQSNFREGLTLTEYVISCYGARKGVVDTALRTATSGYLTRRLVDVAQHVIIRLYDCLTLRGIYLYDLKTNNNKKLLSLKNRLIGRVLAEDIYDILIKSNTHCFFKTEQSLKKQPLLLQGQKSQTKKIALRNQEITTQLIDVLLKSKKPILVRSPLTCQDKNYVCQLCYGWSLSSNRLVSLGESVGIIAAQSIGEPGTQLTMRTFHTGGVFSGQSSNEIRALFDGYIEFPNIINGKFVRTTHGKIAFLTKQKGFCLLKSKTLKIKKILLPLFTLLFVKQGQKVYKNQVLAEPIGFITELEQSVDIFQTIYSEFSGEIRFKNSKSINLLNKTDTNLNKYVNSKTGELWVLASNKQNILKPLNLFIKAGDFIFFNNFICLYNLLHKNNSYSNKIKKSKYNFNNNNFDYKKAKIFNFYNKINNNKILYYSILESNLFINYDYFQVSNIFKKKFIKNNFKKLSTFAFPLDMDMYISEAQRNTQGGHGHGHGHGHLKAKVKNKKIYSNINQYLFKYSNSNNNFNNNIKKVKKTYFLPFFNKKKNSYGFIYKLCINLNSINKVILFEKYNNNSILPINCFSFCQLDQSKFFKIIIKYNNFYIFKTPFNFILTNLFIIENKTILNIFKNIKINHLNLQYSVLFKLKNLKNKHYFNKGNDYSKNRILKKNKKIFISNLKNFSKHNDIKQIFNKSSNLKIDFFELNYNNKKGKIISFFYNKLGTNISENSLFNNLEDVYSISNSVEIFNNFNKTPSYLIFNNSSLNFFILAIFYKLLYIKLNNTFNKIETRLLNKYSLFNKTKYNSNKIEDSVKPYLNIKPPTWSFYFLNNNIKTSINLLAVDKKLHIKSYNLFLNNFSNNIIFFYKNIKLFQNSNNNILLNINKDFLEQKSILIYNKILLNNNNIYFIKSNLYNSNNFNYLFLSFFEKHKTNFNFFYKVQDNFFNKSFFLFNKTNIIKNKKLFFKKNNFIYFKNKQIFLNSKLEKVNNNDLLLTFDKPLAFAPCVFLWASEISKGKDENFFLDKFFIKSTLFNISYISIIFYFLLNQNLKINNLVKSNNNLKNLLLENNKLNINQKKILYLNKKIIYCYFSNYIYSFLSSNFKIDLYKNKNFKKKEKININNNMKYNLIFSNITFLEFIKNINISINIFYNFLNKFNNNEIYIINKKLKKYFFVSFSINNLIAYNNIFLSLFYNNNLKLDSLLVFKYSNYKQLNMLNNLDIIFDKKILNLNLQINKTYFFLSKKNNFNTSIIWFSKSNKLKNKYKLINKINFKYYTNNSFKIKTNYNNFKVFTLYNYNNFNNNKSKSYFFTSCFFNKPYILSKHFISDYFIIKSKNINKLKIINKKNINNKLNFFYLLFNNKFKSKINNFYSEKLLNNNTNTSNSFINSLIKYDNINNLDIFFYKNNFIYNLSYLFEIKWANYLNSFYIKKISKLIQFNSFYNNILTNKQYNTDILIKKYWINDYLKRNILLLANNNYYHDYWLFYKSAFDFLFLPNNYYTGLTKNNNLELYNFNYNFVSSTFAFPLDMDMDISEAQRNTQGAKAKEIELRYCDILNKLFFNKALKIKKIFPINSLYLFRIQIKNNCEQKKLSNTVFDNLSNSNKKMVIKKNYIFNFMKFKFFNFKLKFVLTKYNNIYIQNIFLINTNYIFSYLLSLYYIKNDKLSTDFKNLEIKNNNLFTLNKSFDLNSDNYKLINNYNGWVYIINKSDLLFLNYKKIIPSGHFITKHVLFENIVTLNKFFTFRFKNNFLKTEFNNCNSFLKSFVNFKIKKILLNSIFIFNASKFLNFYLYCSNIYLNNLILKNNYLNIDNYFIFTKFYFYKIKIKTIINYKKLNNSENNIYLINKFYRIVFFQTSNLKKIKYKSSFLNKHFKNQFINKNFLVNNKTDYLNNNLKRIFLIIDSNIYVNKYSRYKPKLLIEKITFKYNSNLVIKFSKFKNICLIEKGFDLNYLNNFSKVFSFYENNLLLPQNDLRYYILKFPFNNVIKRKIFNSPFILIKKQKFLNKFTYCNYLLFNNNKYYLKTLPLDIPEAQRNTQGGHKHKVCLKKIVSKNDGLKRNYFNFNNKKRYTFYDFFSLKGYYCFKNIYINNIFILLLINIIFNFNYKKKFNNNIFVNMNNKKLKIFYIFNSNYKKNFKFYILKNKNNNLCNFSISYCSYIYLYRNNFLNNTYNFSSTIYNINKKMLNNLITLNVYNNKYEKFTNAEKQKNISLLINPLSNQLLPLQKKGLLVKVNPLSNQKQGSLLLGNPLSNQKQRKQGNLKQNFAKIYINFRPFLIENNSFLFQINFIVKKEFTDIYNDLSLIGINKISNNIFNRLKLIKHKIKNVSAYNNKKTLFTNKLPKLKYELSGFKGEVLKSYSSSFFYYSNYFKKFISKQNKKYKNINNIFNLKQNLKQKLSLFPELIYLTNSDFLTYKIPLNLNNYLRINKFKVRLGDFVPCSKEIMLNFAVNQSGQVIFLNKNKLLLRRAKSLLLSPGCICNLKQGDFVNTNSPLLTLTYKNLKTEDIVQGIPKIEQLLEARENVKDQFSLNSLIQLKFKKYKKHYSKKEAVYKSIIFIQQYIVDSVQKVYQSQGVNISDKHIEIIVKQMTSKVRITNPGNTGLLRGDIVYLDWIELINSCLKGKKSQYEPVILGISKACLEMDGFISAASFQETIKILSRAAILQKRDFLRGLKENLILGHLVPIGTGFQFPI